jgi:uncharacterized repeat protein (TIGR03803 family)
MKQFMKRFVPTLVVAVFAAHASAQVITTVKSYRYNATPTPPTHLVRGEDGTLYGMNDDMLYRWQPDGSGFTILKQLPHDLNQEGFIGPLSLSGSTLYGMAFSFGPPSFSGKVFKIDTDGTGYTILKEQVLRENFLRHYQVFFSTTRERPGVVLSGNTLYGWGFKINIDGTGYAELAGFPNSGMPYYLEFTVSADRIFGSNSGDGQYGTGTVFGLNTNGAGYTVLVNVTPENGLGIAGPRLSVMGDTIYGYGLPDRMFQVDTDGTGYSVLQKEGLPRWDDRLVHFGGVFYWASVSFTNTLPSFGVVKMNPDGTGYAELKRFADGISVKVLTVAGGAIYGVVQGGANGVDWSGGALFKLNTDGSGFAVLQEFMVPDPLSDGTRPGPLAVSDGVLYGIDSAGGFEPRAFKINTDGSGFTALRVSNELRTGVPLTASGSTLFGIGNGSGNNSTIFRMNTDGTGHTVLKELVSDDAEVRAGLALSGDALYGTIGNNSGSHSGKIFKLNTNGTGYTILRTFGTTTFDTSTGASTNSEGLFRQPSDSELTVSGSILYGTAFGGGQFGCGTVFKMNTDGTGFTVLKHLTPQQGENTGPVVALRGDTLYGTSVAFLPEVAGGAVWRVNTDGTGFMVVKKFPNAVWDPATSSFPNSDGVSPLPGLAVVGDTLYGTTKIGGQFGSGTIFKVNTDGSGFAVIAHNSYINQPEPGGQALQRLVLSGSTLYGAASQDADHYLGAIYRIDLVPRLSMKRTSANSLAVTWPSVWTDYVLQQNPNALSSVNWSNVTAGIQNDGTNQSLVVNPTDTGRFYRLVSP